MAHLSIFIFRTKSSITSYSSKLKKSTDSLSADYKIILPLGYIHIPHTAGQQIQPNKLNP